MSKLAKSMASLNNEVDKIAKLVISELEYTIFPKVPGDFVKFNEMIGLPRHPGTGKPVGILDYQLEYFDAIQKHHNVILNKSRKIGATETALRTIAYNCFFRYSGHNVMIIAGNRQDQANEFLGRFCSLFENGFFDLNGKKFSFSDIIVSRKESEVRFWNGTLVKTYPAKPQSLRGPEDVICVYISEAAHINSLDDSKVYNALRPNVANIENADFIIESTPNGRRGFYYDLWDTDNEFYKLRQPHIVALDRLISKEFISSEKKNPRIDFEQEYCCEFTSSRLAIFKKEDLDKIFEEKELKDYSHILES